jgi:hypothetical protein
MPICSRIVVITTTNAPEWTRTTTGKFPHKALNLIRQVQMRPPASRSSDLYGFRTHRTIWLLSAICHGAAGVVPRALRAGVLARDGRADDGVWIGCANGDGVAT